jgi:flagellar M-ring protein FliF
MPERFKSILASLTSFWQGLSTPKRVALLVVTLGVLAGGLFLGTAGSREPYATLYGELSTDDAAAVVEKLKATQVPYRLDASGTRIEVPENRVHELRLELASSGLPRGGGVGFEIFDKSQLGSTEFEQQVNLRRALEGELSRSIQTVKGVKAARVHLVIPERRMFAAREERASASVVLKLDRPDSFGRSEIGGIVHLVSSAVPGLGADRVAVVSAEGVTLHRPSADGPAGGTGVDGRGEEAQLVAVQLETKAREQLERVVGPGNADVRVNVALSDASKERTEELFNKNTTALRSEHVTEELAGGARETVAGVPGAQSNLPDATPPGDTPPAQAPVGGTGDGVLRRSQTRNWEVDRVVEKTSTPPGGVEKLSVAVLLNGSRVEKNGKVAFIPRKPDEVAALEEIARRAVGFDEKRGDTLTVKAMEFHVVDTFSDLKLEELPLWKRYLPHAVLGLLGLVSVIVLLLRSRRQKRLAALAAKRELALAERSAANVLPEVERRARLLQDRPEVGGDFRERAIALAAKDPATASMVLKRWLAEGTPAVTGQAPAA